VHEAGSPTPREGRFTLARLRERCDRIEKADDPSLARMADVLRGLLDEVASLRRDDAPRGLCHGDLFRDNVLWHGDEIAALLDFESAAEGPFAFDLAVTMLAWCVGDALDASLARAMFDGYRSVRPIDAALARSFYPEARLAALRFTVTRITDYAMRAHLGANVPRDWKRFWARHEWLVELGERGLAAMLGLDAPA
jgi:homoserine kinase type II